MYFVLEEGTEKTIAMTAYKDAAEIIANSFPARCMIRYTPEIRSGYTEEAQFFPAAIEKTA